VIARNSSFAYNGQAIDVKQVGRELGVRYVLEGSVRKAGDRVRITALLIDAFSGTHLWADRFDGSLEDVFDLQDKVASRVAGIIEPTLQAAEIRRSAERPTKDLSAYDLYLRALPYIATYQWDPVVQGLDLLRQAIERDPGFAIALARAAYCHAQLDAIGRVADRQGNRRIAIDFAHRALQAAGDDALALAGVAHVLGYFNEDIGAAIAIVDRSLALNPSSTYGWRWSGFLRLYAGKPDLAIQHFETSLRLNPRDLRWVQLTGIAIAHFFSGRSENAAATLLLALQENPAYPLANRFLASCYAHMGQLDEAREVVARLRSITPMVVPETVNYRDPEHRELFLSGLRLAAGETT
jgi:adenylate cyclase